MSVVIPVHNAEATLARQLRALAAQSGSTVFETIVVLNSCRDKSREVAESFADVMPLRIVHADRESSAAYARNEGARSASGSFLLFCDADDVVGPDWVAAMVGCMRSGAVDFCGGNISVDRRGLKRWAYERYYRHLEGPHLMLMPPDIPYPISASLGIRRNAFEEVGGYDESFAGAGAEEVDLARRLLEAGKRVGVASGACLTYEPRRDFLGLMRQRRSYASGAARYHWKFGSLDTHSSVVSDSIRLGKTIARALRRERVFWPRQLLVRFLEEWFWLQAVRSLPSAVAQDDVSDVAEDVVTSPEVPETGSLT